MGLYSEEKKVEDYNSCFEGENEALNMLMDTIPSGVKVCKYDKKNSIIYMNQGFLNMLGYSEEEIRTEFNLSHKKLFEKNGLESTVESILKQIKENEEYIVEYHMMRKDGTTVWVLDRGKIINTSSGEQIIQSVLTDITKQKLLEQELRQSNLELGIIYGHVDFGVIMESLSADREIEFINNKALEIFEYTSWKFTAEKKKMKDIVTKESAPEYERDIEILKNKGNSLRFKAQVRKSGGDKIWVGGFATCVNNWRGNKVGIYTFQDITEEENIKTELLRRNEELIISEKRYEIAVKQFKATLYDYIFEEDEMIFPHNMCERLGIPQKIKNAFTSSVWRNVIHPGSLERFKKLHLKAKDGKEVGKDTIIAFDEEGTEICYEIIVTPILNEEGVPIRALALMQDITDINHLEREMQYRQAITLDKKLFFETNISRDIVTELEEQFRMSFLKFAYIRYKSFISGYILNYVYEDDKAMVAKFFDTENIMNNINNNCKQGTIQYRCYDVDRVLCWVQNDITAICDEISGDISIRCYTEDISLQKQKEERIAEEQRFYQLMIAKSATVYEVNISKDKAIRGHEDWYKLYGISQTDSYSQMIREFAHSVIYEEDSVEFLKLFSVKNVREAYESGIRELVCEYRRCVGDKKTWVLCTMHMFEDLDSGDIRGFSYVQDINDKKVKQLELLYRAEHDSLTGVYNKKKTEQAIDEFLETEDGKNGKHAFLIFDLDNFKCINDTLGHALGDVAISRTASKVKELFRDDDILGRIGGDEFVVFMKNITSDKTSTNKAFELCKKVKETYTRGEKEVNLTISVGLAISPKHGTTYEELYKCSDLALYAAKANGRDCFVEYRHEFINSEPRDQVVNRNDLIELETFENNVSEYVFRILYEAPNKHIAIESVLELLGKQYNIDRAYVFESSRDGKTFNNTFEWCNEGIEKQMNNLQNIKYEHLDSYEKNFDEWGIFYLQDIRQSSPNVRKILSAQKTKSLIQFAVMESEKFTGFIGFDYYGEEIELSKRTITVLKTVANMLGVFLTEMRILENAQRAKNVAFSIVDALDSYAYIIDMDTYELLFVNKKTKSVQPTSIVGKPCYAVLKGVGMPCETCPINHLTENYEDKFTKEMKIAHLNKFVRVTASWITWTNEKRACLVECVEILEGIKE